MPECIFDPIVTFVKFTVTSILEVYHAQRVSTFDHVINFAILDWRTFYMIH